MAAIHQRKPCLTTCWFCLEYLKSEAIHFLLDYKPTQCVLDSGFFLIWCYFTCILRNKTRKERTNFTLNPAPMITWSWEKKQNNNLLTMQSGYQLFFVYSLHELLCEYSSPGAQGKSNMAGYGKQILVRDVFLWSISAIYLFAFSSLYIQIPGRL